MTTSALSPVEPAKNPVVVDQAGTGLADSFGRFGAAAECRNEAALELGIANRGRGVSENHSPVPVAAMAPKWLAVCIAPLQSERRVSSRSVSGATKFLRPMKSSIPELYGVALRRQRAPGRLRCPGRTFPLVGDGPCGGSSPRTFRCRRPRSLLSTAPTMRSPPSRRSLSDASKGTRPWRHEHACRCARWVQPAIPRNSASARLTASMSASSRCPKTDANLCALAEKAWSIMT